MGDILLANVAVITKEVVLAETGAAAFECGILGFAAANPVTAGLILAGGVIVACCIVGGVCYYFGKRSRNNAAKPLPPAAKALTKPEAIDILIKVLDRFSLQMGECMERAKAAATKEEELMWMDRWDRMEENLTRTTKCYHHFLDN